jgi:hypothetical protein
LASERVQEAERVAASRSRVPGVGQLQSRGKRNEICELSNESGATQSIITDEIDDPVDSDRFTFTVPPLGFTHMTRTEDDVCPIGQRHFDLYDGVLSARCTDKSID